MSRPTPSPAISFHFRIIRHKDGRNTDTMAIAVDSRGKETKPADWRTLGVFVGDGQKSLEEEELAEMIPIYEMKAYGTDQGKTSRPRRLWLYDDAELTDKDADKPTSPYQKYGWQPVTISIEANEKKKHEKWKTKKKVLDVEETAVVKILLWDPSSGDDANTEFISYFLRSGNPIFGQSFAPPITFEFRGFTKALGLFTLPMNDTTPCKQSIHWVFKQHGKKSANHHYVEAVRHTIRAKLKYEVRVAGTAAGDCRARHSRALKYRQFPVDFVFEHNGISPVTEMYEDIELVYHTNIRLIPFK